MPRRSQRDKYKLEGRCQLCGRQPENGNSCCQLCLVKMRQRYLRRRELRNSSGLCERCGKKPFESGKRKCPQCIAENKEKLRLMRVARKEKHTCYACGKPAFSVFVYCKDCREKAKAIANSSEVRQKNALAKRGKYRFHASRREALRRGRKRDWPVVWDIPEEEYNRLVFTLPCYYCGGPGCETGVGLDRIDNKLGYVVGNVITCCMRCNRTRSDNFSQQEFVRIAKVIREIDRERKFGIVMEDDEVAS